MLSHLYFLLYKNIYFYTNYEKCIVHHEYYIYNSICSKDWGIYYGYKFGRTLKVN